MLIATKLLFLSISTILGGGRRFIFFVVIDKHCSHHKLIAALVLKSRNYYHAKRSQGAKETSNIPQKFQEKVNLSNINARSKRNFVGDRVFESVFVRKLAGSDLLNGKGLVFLIHKSTYVEDFVGQKKLRSSDYLYVVGPLGIAEGEPAGCRLFRQSVFAKAVLNKLCLVLKQNQVFELHPLFDFLFGLALLTRWQFFDITRFEDDHQV